MKIRLSKKIRLLLFCLAFLLTGAFSFLLYDTITHPVLREEKTSLYRYKNSSQAFYRVFLKPNILYGQESLGEGELYLTKYVDYIKVHFEYAFIGEDAADIGGSYEVIAEMEGYNGEGERHTTIWKKPFGIIPRSEFAVKDNKVIINQDVFIKLDDYNAFALQVADESKVSAYTKLTVFMNVHLKADTDKGLIEENTAPAIVIPLNINYFSIEKKIPENKNGAIEEVKKVPVPINKKMVTVYSIALGVSIILLICLMFFTKAVEPQNQINKHLRKILKNYNDRLVAVRNGINPADVHCYEVGSMDDLVKIADEIEKPILYEYSLNLSDINKFYVMDNSTAYVFNLKRSTLQEEVVITTDEGRIYGLPGQDF